MRLILQVYQALRDAPDGLTRAQLEQRTGLRRHQVMTGIEGLELRKAVGCAFEVGCAPIYRLAPGVAEIVDGRRHKTREHRQRLSWAARQAHGEYSPARPPTHAAAAGARHSIRDFDRLPDTALSSLIRELLKR